MYTIAIFILYIIYYIYFIYLIFYICDFNESHEEKKSIPRKSNTSEIDTGAIISLGIKRKSRSSSVNVQTLKPKKNSGKPKKTSKDDYVDLMNSSDEDEGFQSSKILVLSFL